MPSNLPNLTSDGQEDRPRPLFPVWLTLLTSSCIFIWFYYFQNRYGGGRDQSAFEWLYSAWNPENDFEHGPIFPFVLFALVFLRRETLKKAIAPGSMWGVLPILVGAFFYIIAYRTWQPRLAIGALPFLAVGSATCIWGRGVGKRLILPFGFFFLAIPMPSFQQYTTHLQILATSLAHHGAALFHVETIVQGNLISSAHGSWEPLEIAKGCSGIRSLMALLMISGAWACMATFALWKRALLFLSAVPLAILGNSLRVTSIFVIAEYGDPVWARQTWHDWSGLLLFYPISLFLLLSIHAALEGGLPWKKSNKRQLRRTVVRTSH